MYEESKKKTRPKLNKQIDAVANRILYFKWRLPFLSCSFRVNEVNYSHGVFLVEKIKINKKEE